ASKKSPTKNPSGPFASLVREVVVLLTGQVYVNVIDGFIYDPQLSILLLTKKLAMMKQLVMMACITMNVRIHATLSASLSEAPSLEPNALAHSFHINPRQTVLRIWQRHVRLFPSSR